jgi:hypothetical protein
LEEERKKMKEDIKKRMQNKGKNDGLKVEIVGIPGEML